MHVQYVMYYIVVMTIFDAVFSGNVSTIYKECDNW